MANFYDGTQIYEFRYYREKLLERPFFLGVKGITGEPPAEDGKPWSFSYNPLFCEVFEYVSFCKVYRNARMEDYVIYLLHICHYNNDKEDNEIAKIFEYFHKVFNKMLERISVEFVLKNRIELDKIMGMFNLLNIMSDMVFRISKCLPTTVDDSEKEDFLMNIERLLYMKRKIQSAHEEYFPQQIFMAKLIVSGMKKMLFNLNLITEIFIHNNLTVNGLTTIVGKGDLGSIVFGNNSDVNGVEDSLFGNDFLNVDIAEEFIDVNFVKHSISFNSIKIEEILSKAKWEKKTFHIVDGSPILTKDNLDNLEYIEGLLDNPEQDAVKYRSILLTFIRSFWNRSRKTTEVFEYTFLSPEEIQFIFHFMTQILNSLRVFENEYHFKRNVRAAFTQFGDILNYLRFPEVNRAIGLETSVILSKSLMFLLSDPTVKSFLPGLSAELMVVLIRINIFLSSDRNMASVHASETEQPFTITVRDIKPIEKISDISKSRNSSWRKLLDELVKGGNIFQVHNEGECPVCSEKTLQSKFCLLLCQHKFCESCIKKIIKNSDERKLCPVCWAPLCEYLQSDHIEEIYSAFQQ